MHVDWLRGMALLLTAAMGLFAAAALVASRRAHWRQHFYRRRWAWALAIAAGVVLVKVTEDVLGHESGAIDQALLLDVHHAVPAALLGFFRHATLTGSFRCLGPAAGLLAVLLWLGRKRFEAAQLVLSLGMASLLIYLAKTAVGRARPALWDTQWYWGSSFPSGHTLGAAAFATAVFLCVARCWPRARLATGLAAILWVATVGFSRLVLGVHWPTDVLAAACAGALVAAGVNAALLAIHRRNLADAGSGMAGLPAEDAHD